MPKVGRGKYDADAVYQWLLEQGIAEPSEGDTGPIARTRADCGAALGVTSRTISEWATDPTFPGRAGTPGQTDGYYPIWEIERWLNRRKDKGGGDGETAVVSSREKLADVRYQKGLIDLAKLRGQVVDAVEAQAFYARTNGYVVATLKGLPAKLDHALPADFDPKARATCRRIAQQVVNECRDLISELIKGDADE